jgi:hypothetical protein
MQRSIQVDVIDMEVCVMTKVIGVIDADPKADVTTAVVFQNLNTWVNTWIHSAQTKHRHTHLPRVYALRSAICQECLIHGGVAGSAVAVPVSSEADHACMYMCEGEGEGGTGVI